MESSQNQFKVMLKSYFKGVIIAIALALFIRIFFISVYRIPTGSMQPNLLIGDFIFVYKPAYNFKIFGRKLLIKSPKKNDVVVFLCPGYADDICVKRVVATEGDNVRYENGKFVLNDTISQYAPNSSEIIKDFSAKSFYEILAENINGKKRLILKNKEENISPVELPPEMISEDFSKSTSEKVSDKSLEKDGVVKKVEGTISASQKSVIQKGINVGEGQFFVLGDNRDSSDDSRNWGTIPIEKLEGEAILIWLSLDWQNTWLNGSLPSLRWSRVLSTIR